MYNSCTVIGRLARDPDLKSFENGGRICRLRVLTSRFWKDDQGEFREKVDGHNVSILARSLAERSAQNLKKGDLVLVEAPVETRKWDGPDGQTRYATELVVRPYLGTVRRMASPGGKPGSEAAPQQVGEVDLDEWLSSDLDDDDGFADFGDMEGLDLTDR